MEKFDLITACALIASRLSAKKKNVEGVWRVWFPSMIYDEMKEAEAIQKIVGLRGPIGVQQRICRRFWKHCFKSEPLPWIEDPVVERPTCGQGEVMEIALMKEAMTVASTGDIQAAILMLATNSPDAKKTDSKEPVKGPASSKPAPAPPKPVTKPALPLENYSIERNEAAVESGDKNTRQSDWRRRDDRSRSPSSSRSLIARRRSF